MKKNLWFFAAAALALVSCDEEALVNSPVNQSNKVLTVSFEQETSSTRVNIAADNGLSWSFGDAIAVFDENESSYKYNYIGRVTDNFQVEDDNNVPQNIIGAAFPHSKDVSLDNDILTMNLPSSYDQTTLGELDMPLWGKINGNNITLKHLADLSESICGNILALAHFSNGVAAYISQFCKIFFLHVFVNKHFPKLLITYCHCFLL